MSVKPWNRIAAWLDRKLTHKFLLLLAGFLLLQLAQLGTGVVGVLHVGEDSGAINEAGRQRMRTLLLSSLASEAVDSGAWDAARRQSFRDAIALADAYFERYAAYVAQEEAPDSTWRTLLEQTRADWERGLRPLLAAIGSDPAAPWSREAALRYRSLAFETIPQLDAFVGVVERHAREDAGRLAAYHAVALGASILLGLLGLYLAHRVVSRPLRRLIEGANAIAGGAYDQRVPVASQDEVGELAATFNGMAVAIGVRTARLRAFSEVAASITSSLSLKDVLEEIMRCGADLSGADAACVAFYDAQGERFTTWTTQGLSDAFVRNFAILRGGLADEAFASCAGIASNDRPGTFHKLSQLARDEGIRGFVCLPLASKARRLGVIYFYRKDCDTFLPEETELLRTFANLAAGAIANARLHEATHDLAITDTLTGLRNRRLFDQELADALARARRDRRPLGLLMIDIDHFKRVNDSYGHAAGDQALEALGRLIAAELRESDLGARFGGEEFAVILPYTDGACGKQLAERIRCRVAGSVLRLAGGRELRLTVSIGNVAGDGAPQRLLQHADQALYTAKQEGRNRVCLHEETLRARVERDPGHLVDLLEQSLEHIPAVVTAICAKEGYFRHHGDDVAGAALRLAEALGLASAEREALRLAALLHDVGMLLLPEELVEKKSSLTPEDQRRIESHAAAGAELLARVSGLRHIAPVVRHHHERFDGGGYPAGLRGKAIPHLARVLAVADAWGSMAGSDAEAHALDALRAGAGTQFDPEIVAALMAPPSAFVPIPKYELSIAA
jgi:diguanylate cyclase (GGDEF)-like protein/putative nucleotidyltransferase with HDIG domain